MKFPLLFKACLFTALLFIAGVSKATDYYVSASGSDANNGTSTSTPWKTLTKVESVSNAGTIKAGDKILFKCGDSFIGKVAISSLWGHTAKSGTATSPITLGSYGTGAKPVFLYPTGGSATPESRYLLYFVGVDYWVIDGLNFTDLNTNNDHVAGANNGIPIYLGSYGDAPCNHWTVQNVDISLCGMGIVIVGDYNTVQNCNMSNFKNLKSTPNTGGSTAWEDYGANPFTIIWSNNNIITHNNVSGGWAESMDFGYNGGFCETIGTCSNNEISYNTIVDCNGLSEFGQGGNSVNNLYAYNKIIDCGAMFWVNGDCQLTNAQFFNNTIIETTNSRFAQGSPNAGAGVVSPEAISHLNVDAYMFDYSGSSQTASTVFNLKNNIIQISNPLRIAKSGSKMSHDYNVLKLSGGSSFGLTLGSHDKSTSAAIFSNTTSPTPELWDLKPPVGSPPIDAGTDVGFDADFVGNPVPTVPNAGILESASGGSGSTLAASSTAGTISCNGGTTTVTVTATGGTAPYSGAGTFTVSAGTYSYTVTDATGTTKTTTITVPQPSLISIILSSGTIAIYGGTTTLNVTASGGTGSYTYQLNSGSYQSANSFSGVAAGTYTVTVKDVNGCTSTKNITITQPAQVPPLVAASSAGVISCNGGSTLVTVTATGGTSPYTGTGSFSVSAGTYNYTVTDASGITAITSITVSQPSAIAATLSAGTIAVYGGTTTLTVAATGGTGAYTYKLNAGLYQPGNTFSNVAAGTHTIKVKDANACIATYTITVTQPAAADPLNVSASAGTIICNGETTSVLVSATGGTAPYTGTGTFTVSAGSYSYTVTDAGGQTATTSGTISQPTLITVTVSPGTIAVYGGTTSVTVTASGGTGSYSYQLNTGSYQSSNIFTGVPAGNHSITVKDANGCTSVKNFTLTQPQVPALKASSSATTINCNGGNATVTVTASGGVAPYTGTGIFTVVAGNYTYTITDAAGTTTVTSINVSQPAVIEIAVSSGTILVYGGTTNVTVTATGGNGSYAYKLDADAYQASNIFNNVEAGDHNVTVKDANGCTSVKAFNISQPANNPIIVTATATPINCNGSISTITVAASGGTAPYTGTGLFTGYAGTYTYSVTDARGTISSTSLTITQPASITITINAGTITQTGATTTASATATGGTTPYTFSVDGGAYQAGNSFSGIAAGNHSMAVKDGRGCTSVKAFTITASGSQNLKLVLVSRNNVSCRGGNNGSIKVQASGGRAPYTYQLNDGRYTTTNNFNNLMAGFYRINAKDGSGNIVTLVTYLFDGRNSCGSNRSTGTLYSGVETIRDIEGDLNITAYPNPTSDHFSLAVESKDAADVIVVVMNGNGTKVFESKGSVHKKYTFGESFTSGIYFVKVTQGKDVKTTKIIKTN